MYAFMRDFKAECAEGECPLCWGPFRRDGKRQYCKRPECALLYQNLRVAEDRRRRVGLPKTVGDRPGNR